MQFVNSMNAVYREYRRVRCFWLVKFTLSYQFMIHIQLMIYIQYMYTVYKYTVYVGVYLEFYDLEI